MRISDWSSDVCSSDLYGEDGGGALAKFREALALQPGQPRAMQGLAATESAMIRSAEIAAEKGDFDGAKGWLAAAAKVRPEMSTVPDAVARIERLRGARIARLRDLGVAALGQPRSEEHTSELQSLMRISNAV